MIHPEIAELDGIEESEADRGGLVDRLELGCVAVRSRLLLAEGLSEGPGVVNISSDAKPVEDGAVSSRTGRGAQTEPAEGTVATTEGGEPRCRSLRR